MSQRVFLDANVLFSAAWRAQNGLLALWGKADISLFSSHYAVDEANRNLDHKDEKTRLAGLLNSVTLTGPLPAEYLPEEAASLPPKDQPILLAAMAIKAHILLTGDRAHFGNWYGKTIAGISVQLPAQFLGSRQSSP
jgi:predicted nucleic acid-binding protein